MNYFGGGDAALPFGVKGSSGRGRGGVKPNAPAPIAGSSFTALQQQQRPAAIEPVPRDCGPHWNALPQLDAGDDWRQHSQTTRDSQVQKVRPRPESSILIFNSQHASMASMQGGHDTNADSVIASLLCLPSCCAFLGSLTTYINCTSLGRVKH